MNRKDLQKIALMRVEDAKILLDAGHFDGAYYILGYAIECALKSCIAKETKEFDFPNKDIANKAHTHNITNLLNLTAFKLDLLKEVSSNEELAKNWNIVVDWDESYRYEYGIAEPIARDLFKAVTADKVGILPWLTKYW